MTDQRTRTPGGIINRRTRYVGVTTGFDIVPGRQLVSTADGCYAAAVCSLLLLCLYVATSCLLLASLLPATVLLLLRCYTLSHSEEHELATAALLPSQLTSLVEPPLVGCWGRNVLGNW